MAPAPTASYGLDKLVVLSFCSRTLVYLLALVSSCLPLFDASPKTLQLSKFSQPFLRWDAFHFASIADGDYLYEYQWAFFPGVPLAMRYGQKALQSITGYSDLMFGGALAVMVCDTTRTMYQLSLHHLGSPKLAYLATLLSLLPSSPATLRLSAYADPFFAYFAYKGMWACAQSRYLTASLHFAIASTFRSNGILLGGFLLWDLVMNPLLQTGKIHLHNVLRAIPLTSLTLIPFIYQQYSGYLSFCADPDTEPAVWCRKTIPFIYSHVQAKYWDNGFLRYWTVAQIPNFLIAAPPFVSIASFSIFVLMQQLKRTSISPFTRPSLIPHAIHAIVFCSTILLSGHVQIILRQASSMPMTYWAAAWLMMEYPRFGRWWVGWSVVWGVISVVLWSTFLPPA